MVGRLSAILGCRSLVLLHDAQGHPLLATTHRGDQRLIIGSPTIVKRYEQGAGTNTIQQIIVDCEVVSYVCQVALVNLVIWTRDRYFLTSYERATWKRLAPFSSSQDW